MLNIKEKNKGVSVLLAILILTVLLGIGFGLSDILLKQTKMLGEIGYSVAAFSAADSGIEEYLYRFYKGPQPPPDDIIDGQCGDATFNVVTKCGSKNTDSCPAGFEFDMSRDVYFYTKSIGAFHSTKRAIEIQY